MPYRLQYDPGPGISDTLLKWALKNERIAQRIKEKMGQHLVQEGLIDADPETAIQVQASANAIVILVDRNAGSVPQQAEFSLDDLVPTYDAMEYLHGAESKFPDDKDLEERSDELKEIITAVLLQNVPKSKV